MVKNFQKNIYIWLIYKKKHNQFCSSVQLESLEVFIIGTFELLFLPHPPRSE